MYVVNQRAGVVMAGAVVTLMIVAVTGAALLQSLASQRFQSRQQRHSLQAMWMAESGVSRGAAKLRADPSYKGETWKLPASSPAQQHPAEIVITVKPAEASDGPREISVVATYPAGALHRVQHSRTLLWRP